MYRYTISTKPTITFIKSILQRSKFNLDTLMSQDTWAESGEAEIWIQGCLIPKHRKQIFYNRKSIDMGIYCFYQ